MVAGNPTVLITGVAGDLGVRLLPVLADFQVIGVDLKPPVTNLPLRFVQLDLAKEESCRQLYLLLKEARVVAVIHLAFVIDPVSSGDLDLDQMWQINVAGTARVMEAITEANRDEVIVQKFIFPSSVSVYGSDLATPATETTPFAAHTLPYALHKMECDKVVQQRAPALRGCSVFMLRPHIFAGASVNNYFLGAFRGTPNGPSKRAAKMRQQGKRLPCILPHGKRYLANRMQFVHVDDMARLIQHILSRTEPESQRLTILNVAGRGEALTLEQCIQVARAELFRVPGKAAFRMLLTVLSKLGLSTIPPQALPYMTGEYLMNTERLQSFLGSQHTKVIQYTIADAFADSFDADLSTQPKRSSAATSE